VKTQPEPQERRRHAPILPGIDSFPQRVYVDVMSSKNDLTSMTVSLPSTQKEYVREQAAATGCSTPSEYIRRLIHADQAAREQQELELKLIAGLDSPKREMNAKEWSKFRATLRTKLAQARKSR
jgi:Arc/MetJ-type ribon-helix-helix transcriptional regulator